LLIGEGGRGFVAEPKVVPGYAGGEIPEAIAHTLPGQTRERQPLPIVELKEDQTRFEGSGAVLR